MADECKPGSGGVEDTHTSPAPAHNSSRMAIPRQEDRRHHDSYVPSPVGFSGPPWNVRNAKNDLFSMQNFRDLCRAHSEVNFQRFLGCKDIFRKEAQCAMCCFVACVIDARMLKKQSGAYEATLFDGLNILKTYLERFDKQLKQWTADKQPPMHVSWDRLIIALLRLENTSDSREILLIAQVICLLCQTCGEVYELLDFEPGTVKELVRKLTKWQSMPDLPQREHDACQLTIRGAIRTVLVTGDVAQNLARQRIDFLIKYFGDNGNFPPRVWAAAQADLRDMLTRAAAQAGLRDMLTSDARLDAANGALGLVLRRISMMMQPMYERRFEIPDNGIHMICLMYLYMSPPNVVETPDLLRKCVVHFANSRRDPSFSMAYVLARLEREAQLTIAVNGVNPKTLNVKRRDGTTSIMQYPWNDFVAMNETHIRSFLKPQPHNHFLQWFVETYANTFSSDLQYLARAVTDNMSFEGLKASFEHVTAFCESDMCPEEAKRIRFLWNYARFLARTIKNMDDTDKPSARLGLDNFLHHADRTDLLAIIGPSEKSPVREIIHNPKSLSCLFMQQFKSVTGSEYHGGNRTQENLLADMSSVEDRAQDYRPHRLLALEPTYSRLVFEWQALQYIGFPDAQSPADLCMALGQHGGNLQVLCEPFIRMVGCYTTDQNLTRFLNNLPINNPGGHLRSLSPDYTLMLLCGLAKHVPTERLDDVLLHLGRIVTSENPNLFRRNIRSVLTLATAIQYGRGLFGEYFRNNDQLKKLLICLYGRDGNIPNHSLLRWPRRF